MTLSAPGARAQDHSIQLDLPAQPLEKSLRAVATAANTNVLFDTGEIARLRAPALKGKVTLEEALSRLLAGSGLKFRYLDDKTIVLAVEGKGAASNQGNPADLMRVAMAAEFTDDNRAAVSGSATDARIADEGAMVTVTGSRIRGLLGAASIQPVLTLTAEDIERTGAVSLGEVLGYVPQVSSHTNGTFLQSAFAFGASNGSSTDTRITATLRGAPPGGTLLLINGRRAPRNGQEDGQDGYDLSGIPLAAIERIEILLDGASAIYGADAVGGVINVILKRSYQGGNLKVSYGNTFDTDVHVFDGNLTYGFGAGKLGGVVTLSHAESGNLMWTDRKFLATQDRRPWGGENGSAFQIPGGNGMIILPAGNAAGLPANTIVTIPPGANGTNLSAADYVPYVGQPPGTDMAIWASYNSPYLRRAVVANLEYGWNDRVALFGEFRANDNESVVTSYPLSVNFIEVPADAPGNVFGVPVLMGRYLIDLPAHGRVSKSRNLSAAVGMRASIGRDWRLEASIGPNYTRPEYSNPLGYNVSSAKFQTALSDPDPARRPNLFYDATTPGLNPNRELLMQLGEPYKTVERGLTWIYQLSAEGPVAEGWAGEIRASFGAEYRSEEVDFPLQDPEDLFGTRARDRYATGIFAELRIPLLSDRQGIPLVNRLEALLALRRDLYGRDEFPDATTPRYGMMYRPFSWLMARGSYGEGYMVPTLNSLYAPAWESEVFFSPFNPGRDIYRGNEALPIIVPVLTGGNPNLSPEETENTSAGIVLEMPIAALAGLSFSWDYFDHKYFNRVSQSLTFAERLSIFPELFVRGDKLPGDPPEWPGPIVSYDSRAVNIAYSRITGWDAGLNYLRDTAWGQWRMTYHVSHVYRYENRARRDAPPSVVGVPQSLPMRMYGELFWKRSGLEAGVLMSFRDVYKRTLTEPETPAATRWDARLSYDLSQSPLVASGRGWTNWLANTRMSLTIVNVLDKGPPISRATGIPESSLIDALGRRYSLSFTTSFGTPRRAAR